MMKNVELGSRKTFVRRAPIWLLSVALACLFAGLSLGLYAPQRSASTRVEPHPTSREQSEELERLKQAVNLLERKSDALAAAITSTEREVERRAPVAEPAKEPASVEPTRSAAEIVQDEITDVEVRFASEKDGSRESLLAARAMQAELGAAPVGAARVTGVVCSPSICRATLEQDVNAKPLDMASLIEATPSVRRESMFNYEEEGAIKRVTIYSAREGHHLGSAEGDNAAKGSAL